MITREKVNQHLSEIGYYKNAHLAITMFCKGAGLFTMAEDPKIIPGKNTWEDFYNWYNSENSAIIIGDIVAIRKDPKILWEVLSESIYFNKKNEPRYKYLIRNIATQHCQEVKGKNLIFKSSCLTC